MFASVLGPVRHTRDRGRLKAVRAVTFSSAGARMQHIATRLEAGWRNRLATDRDGDHWMLLSYGRIFRFSERIQLPAREWQYYSARQKPGRFFA